MKTKLALVILALFANLAVAQDKMSEQLRKAIVEEEGNQNLDKAVQAYQSILAQFDEERKTAAAALFHLADCYRKQGKKDQAIVAYKRIVQDFSDQTKLAESSRNYLSRTFGISETQAPDPKREIAEARQLYRSYLLEEIQLVDRQISNMQKIFAPDGPEATALKRDLLELRQTLALFDAGLVPIPRAPSKK